MSTHIRAALERLVAAYAECQGKYEEYWHEHLDGPMAAARAALAAEPVGEGPSDVDVDDLCAEFGFHYEDKESLAMLHEMFCTALVCTALARWGRQFGDAKILSDAADLLQQPPAPAPAVVPVAVAERLPGEGDCDAEGRCWWCDGDWHLKQVRYRGAYDTHWLPFHAIPLPQAENPPTIAPQQ